MDVSPSSDTDLIRRLRGGEARALRELYDRFADRTFRFLLRLAGRRDIAMDLQQDTWLAAAKHSCRIAEDTDFNAWLFTIARNKYRSWRRFALLDFRRFDRTFDAMPEVGVAPESELWDEAAALEKALWSLPPAQREVLLLVAVEGLEAKQAALVLGIEPDAARQRLARARAALLAYLNTESAGGYAEVDNTKKTKGDAA